MTPAEMAEIHARAFAGSGRAWRADEFASLLASSDVFAVEHKAGFALGRVSADEAELLTIATAPEQQRQGVGRDVLARFEAQAAARGAGHAFLDVADDNCAARALYHAAGYAEVGRRKGYYRRPDGAVADALVLRKPLI